MAAPFLLPFAQVSYQMRAGLSTVFFAAGYQGKNPARRETFAELLDKYNFPAYTKSVAPIISILTIRILILACCREVISHEEGP